MNSKLLIPCLYLNNGKAVKGFGQEKDVVVANGNPVELGKAYGNHGADAILVFDFSTEDASHDIALGLMKEIVTVSEVPVIGAGNVKRMEDVKKLLYAGCQKAVLNMSKVSNIEIMEEVSKKFGKDKIIACIRERSQFVENQTVLEEWVDTLLCPETVYEDIAHDWNGSILVLSSKAQKEDIHKLLQQETCHGAAGVYFSHQDTDFMAFKKECKSLGIHVNTFESKISWSDFKLNAHEMIPVVVQDYKTNEVLMLAYMNELAFQTTLETGLMTYWSRSRNELWTKGLTSGHVQYVKSLTIDCDNDTILAKVSQVGAACHTGNKTCFFNELMKKEYDDTNPLTVFQEVFDVIQDRKVHPKDGSYTNYLFDKGIDKILKKVGEECTEIVIAAKNPDKEEIKYEIADFLYHVMVLMAEKGVTWEEITRELARR